MHTTELFRRDCVTILGVLNVTPDSFSDGGRFVRAGQGPPDSAAVLAEARAQLASGAHVLDVGGESTRPGAAPVTTAEELARTRPVIAALAKALAAPISIDTRRAEVAEAALDAGACIVNDVSGGAHDPELLGVAARRGALLILGHLRGDPATMQQGIAFADVLAEVGDELAARIERALDAGVARERIVADPGHRLREERRTQRRAARECRRAARAARGADPGRPLAQELPRCADRRARRRAPRSRDARRLRDRGVRRRRCAARARRRGCANRGPGLVRAA